MGVMHHFVKRQELRADKRRPQVKLLWDMGYSLAEIVTELRYHPVTIASDVLEMIEPERANRKSAYDAYAQVVEDHPA